MFGEIEMKLLDKETLNKNINPDGIELSFVLKPVVEVITSGKGEEVFIDFSLPEEDDTSENWAYAVPEDWYHAPTTYETEEGDLLLTCPQLESKLLSFGDSDGLFLECDENTQYILSQDEFDEINAKLKKDYFESAYQAYLKDLEEV